MDIITQNTNTPLPYKEWVLYNPNVNTKQSFYLYNRYVKEWYDNNKTEKLRSDNLYVLQQEYLDLLSKIQVFFSEEEVEKWYSTIDLNNENELILSIPFFSRKLKDVAIFFVEQREELKAIKAKTDIAGTNKGLENILYSYILTAFTKKNYAVNVAGSRFYNQIPQLSAIADKFKVSVEELYDTHNYFDISPKQHISKYFDLSSSKTQNFFKERNIDLGELEWLYSTGVNTSFFTEIVDSIRKRKFSGSITTIANVIKEVSQKAITVVERPFSFKPGSTLFYWTTSFSDINPDYEIITAPVKLNESDFLSTTTTPTLRFPFVDKLYKITKLDIEGAWLEESSQKKLQTYMVTNLPVGKQIKFKFPYPGYGLIGESLPWTGPSLIENSSIFTTLEPEEKAEIYKQYWNFTPTTTSFDPLYIQDLKIFKANATEEYSESDKILLNLQGSAANTHQEYWYYAGNKTDLSIADSINKIYWPLFKFTDDEIEKKSIPFTITQDWSTPRHLKEIDISYATAATEFGNGDVMYKIPFPEATIKDATEAAWLSSKNLSDYQTDYTKFSNIDGPQQSNFTAKFNSGELTPFIWSAVNATTAIPLSSVFKNIEHSLDCEYLQQEYKEKLYETSVFKSTKENSSIFNACNCKAINFSPFGHPGQKFTDYNSSADFIVLDDRYFSSVDASNGFPSNFNLAEWLLTYPQMYETNHRELSALSGLFIPFYRSVSADLLDPVKKEKYYYIQGPSLFAVMSSLKDYGLNNFAWYQLTPNKTDAGWSYGQWVDFGGKPSTLALSAGARYYYYRNNLKRDTSKLTESLPYYIAKYRQNELKADTVWIKAVLSADGVWRSTDKITDMVLAPGDLYIYDHKNNYDVTYRQVSSVFTNSPTATKITDTVWSDYDYVTPGEQINFVIPNQPNITLYSGQLQNLNNIFFYKISAVDWEIRLTDPPSNYSGPIAFEYKTPAGQIPANYSVAIPFIPLVTGKYSIYKVIIRHSGSPGVFEIQNPNIPAVTCVPLQRETKVDVKRKYSKTNFMLNIPLSGWDICNYRSLSSAPNVKPFWVKTGPANGLILQNNKFEFVDDYNFYSQPRPANDYIYGGQEVSYTNVGNNIINWIQPLYYNLTDNSKVWKKINIALDKNIPLTENTNYSEYLTKATTTYPTPCISDIVIEQTNAGEMVKYVFFTSKTDLTINFKLSTINPNFLYVSGSNVTIITSLPFQPDFDYANLTNVHYPTIASLNNIESLYSREDLGGYFTHKNLGLLNYVTNNIKVKPINTFEGDSLSSVNYTNSYGIPNRGLSKETLSGSYTYDITNSSWLKEAPYVATSLTKPEITKTYTKFLGYQTKEESTQGSNTGVVTTKTRQSPWSGPKNETWVVSKNFQPDFRGLINTEYWKTNQVGNLDDSILYKWTTDIFGNQYSLYKPDLTNSLKLQKTLPGSLWVKNIAGDVKPATYMLSAIFDNFKYTTLHKYLTGNEIQDVEMYYDVLFILMKGGMILLRLDYDYETGAFKNILEDSNFVDYEKESGAIQLEIPTSVPTGLLLQNVEFPPRIVNKIAITNLLIDKYNDYTTYWTMRHKNPATINKLIVDTLSGMETEVVWGDGYTTKFTETTSSLAHQFTIPVLTHNMPPEGILSGVNIQSNNGTPVTIVWGDGTADFDVYKEQYVDHTYIYSATFTTITDHYLKKNSKFKIFKTNGVLSDIDYVVTDVFNSKTFVVSGVYIPETFDYNFIYGINSDSKPYIIGYDPVPVYNIAKTRYAILHSFSDYRFIGSWLEPNEQKIYFCYVLPYFDGETYQNLVPILYSFSLVDFTYQRVYPLKDSILTRYQALKNLYITEITSTSFAYNDDSKTAILTLMVNAQPQLAKNFKPFSKKIVKTVYGIMINIYLKQMPNFDLSDIEVILPFENVVILQENNDYVLQESFIEDYYDNYNLDDGHFIEVEQ